MAKRLLLIGRTGDGKSSFVNRIICLNRNKGIVAQEGEGFGNSCTSKIIPYQVKDNSEFGTITLIDTIGFCDNHTKTEDKILILKILRFCVNNDYEYNFSAVLYFMNISEKRPQIEKDIQTFCNVFQCKVDDVKRSLIWIVTHVNDIKSPSKKMNEITKWNEENVGVSVVFWDSEEPLENQFCHLKERLNGTTPFKVGLAMYENEILEQAKVLQKNEQVPKQMLKRKTIKNTESQKFTFLHKETTSHYGVWNIFTLGITKLASEIIDKMTEKIAPDFPVKSFNRKIESISYNKIRDANINNWTLSQKYSDDCTRCYLYSTITCDSCMFGVGEVEFTVTCKFTYDTADLLEEVAYVNKHSLDYYKAFATEDVLREKFKEITDDDEESYKSSFNRKKHFFERITNFRK